MVDRIKHICSVLQKMYDIPAVSVGYVNSTENVCFGQGSDKGELHAIDNSKNLIINETTVFGLGSVSKAFTPVCLAMLLEKNPGLTWDTPVTTILGEEFSFSDKYRETNVCLRDILSHKVGIELGETDFGYMMGNISRNCISRNLGHLPFAAEFRTKLMYNNFMYAVAGIVAEKISGQSYEDLIMEITGLLGMEDTTFVDNISSITNIAKPHVGINCISTPIDFKVHRMSSTVAPAASLFSTAKDMLKWMKFLLNKGNVDGIQVVNPRLLEECWKPQFALPRGKLEWDGYVSKPTFPVTETRDTYGFGWYIGTYRGYRTIAHSGELFGYDCLVTLIPDMDIGIYTNINGPGGEAAFISNQLLHYYISDILLGYEPWLNEENIITFPEPWKSRDTYFIPRTKSVVDKTIPCERSLEVYTGRFQHGFLGIISIEKQNNELCFKMGKIGEFLLYPNGISQDEFRMEGVGSFQFIHQWDLYSPSDWMTVKFSLSATNGEDNIFATELCCSLFESGPVFKRV